MDSAIWTKKVSTILEESRLIPMWGKAPLFPWESLSQLLMQGLGVPRCTLKFVGADWKEESSLLAGLGDQPMMTSFVMTPLAPQLFWVMPKEDVEKLSKLLLDQEQKRSFKDPEFQKGFFRFSMLSVLKLFDELKAYPGLSLKLSSAPLPKSKAYCADVNISLENTSLSGRVICPLDFHRVFTSHFASRPFSLDAIDASLELLVSLRLGQVTLSLEEWSGVTSGDFVILDQCHYHPATKQGSLLLTLGTAPLFIVKLKHHEIKILDYALELQEENVMSDRQEDEEEMFEDEELPMEQEDLTAKVIAAQEIPLSLCVELAHIKMSLKDLLHLKPGNTLPLSVSVEQGVSITLNSKTVAKGELLQLGDMLGVKISEVSH